MHARNVAKSGSGEDFKGYESGRVMSLAHVLNTRTRMVGPGSVEMVSTRIILSVLDPPRGTHFKNREYSG